jgi:uncharacterized protein (DUF1800 family)
MMNQTILVRRETLPSGAVAVTLSLLLVLGQVCSFTAQAQGRQTAKKSALTGDQLVAHVLSRLTFGARPGDFERVKAIGVNEFIRQQLDSDSLDDVAVQTRLRKLPTLGMATPVIFEQYTPPKPVVSPSPAPAKSPDKTAANSIPQIGSEKTDADKMSVVPANESMKPVDAMQKPEESGRKREAGAMPTLPAASPKPTPPPKNPQMVVTELQRAALLRAVYSERQLYELMVGFWENHFSIFANKDDDRYLLTSYDRDTIRPFALARFRDLLGATAHSPAMLFYLDNWRSSVARPYPATKTKPAGTDGGLNENYARELMELHTLGVDGGYTQKDVQEVARCFSGWTIQKPNEEGLFLYRPGLHDNGEKIVLGHKIPAGGGLADGERVLDILATQPATAHFIATKLARRFVSDDPPPSVIDRAAAVFLKTDGSIRETLRAIVTAPEFFAVPTYRAKMRSPFEYVAAAMRALNADTDGDRPVLDAIGRMGQPVFGRITPDGYADRADQWLSSGAMVARFNFASALATNRIKGTTIDVSKLLPSVDQANKDSVATQLIRLTIFGDVSAGTRTALEKTARTASAVNQVAPSPSPAANVAVGYSGRGTPPQTASAAPPVTPYISELITLLIGSPEFQQR